MTKSMYHEGSTELRVIECYYELRERLKGSKDQRVALSQVAERYMQKYDRAVPLHTVSVCVSNASLRRYYQANRDRGARGYSSASHPSDYETDEGFDADFDIIHYIRQSPVRNARRGGRPGSSRSGSSVTSEDTGSMSGDVSAADGDGAADDEGEEAS